MKRKNVFWKGILACTLAVPGILYAGAATAPSTPENATPNFIVIMADDLGYADVGFNGGKQIPTPNIDSISENGAHFSSAYTSYSVCGPSRAGFITGRYQQRFGFGRNPQYRPDDPNMGLPQSEETFAEVLKKVGYTSGIIGKWHLGAHETNHPLNRGFDFFFGHLGGGHRYFPEELTIKDSYGIQSEEKSYKTWIMQDHEPVQTTQYLTDEFSDAAVSFVEKNKEKPFFLFLSYNAPHGPLQAPEKDIARFSQIEGKKRRTYAAMVSIMDEGIGRVLGKLKELDLSDNTLIFFLSDNGGPENKNASDNGPLCGQKSDVWEGGFRVPFAMQWPGKIPAGLTYDQPISSLDILATAVALTQAPTDPERPLDGVNLLPYLTAENKGIPHDTIYLRKFDQQRYAVRRGDYKLVIPGADQKPVLFNLAKDLGEENDILSSNPEKAEELEALRKQWDTELIDPIFLGLIHTGAWGNKRVEAKTQPQDTRTWSKEKFVRLNREWSRNPRKGWNFNLAKTEAKFDELDTNNDGQLTFEEREAGKKNQ